MNWYDVCHLDRWCLVDGGTFTAGDPGDPEDFGYTTFTLPYTDNTVDTYVLGPDFAGLAGRTRAVTNNGDGTVVIGGGDYSSGEIMFGRGYTMMLELSQSYVRDDRGVADIDAGLQIAQVNLSYHNTGKVSIRSTMADGRAERTSEIDVDPIEERGRLRAWHNGDSELIRHFIENDSPKPCTVTSVEIAGFYSPRIQLGAN